MAFGPGRGRVREGVGDPEHALVLTTQKSWHQRQTKKTSPVHRGQFVRERLLCKICRRRRTTWTSTPAIDPTQPRLAGRAKCRTGLRRLPPADDPIASLRELRRQRSLADQGGPLPVDA